MKAFLYRTLKLYEYLSTKQMPSFTTYVYIRFTTMFITAVYVLFLINAKLLVAK